MRRDDSPVAAPALLALPMHGQRKLSVEGYRTRDGHLIEWFGRLLGDRGAVDVVSRPEPFGLATRYPRSRIAANTRPVDTSVLRAPPPWDRKIWWATSAEFYPVDSLHGAPVVMWNPFAARALPQEGGYPVALDLLDDWTVHHAFGTIRREVEEAYRRAFAVADTVFANSEGTVELARRFGRSDVRLLPNGCDPERFAGPSRASGQIVVGYLGKIGRRVDLDLVIATARARPAWRFVFAGPILDREYRAPLARIANIELLGDIRYDRVPEVLQTFDIGWVPHRVGEGEVGGDAIKIYEYHAAGLPVLTTPIIGAGRRGIAEVRVAPAAEHLAVLEEMVAGRDRVPRVDRGLPVEHTWCSKAIDILRSLRVDVENPHRPPGTE